MNAFIQKHTRLITGVLSGFDRLVLRGILRQLAYAQGMLGYLCNRRIRLKDFAQHAQQVTEQVTEASLQEAKQSGRPVLYLPSSQTRKEDMAREIAERDQIRQGLVCVLRAVEPCLSYEVAGNRQTHQIELRVRQRKCLHLYHYRIHPVFGFLHARLQTWYPFNLQVCLNGREWLSRQLDHAGIGYQRRDNCFPRIDDLVTAQRLFDRQLAAAWPSLLEGIVNTVHPAARELFVLSPQEAPRRLHYYWSVLQSEWASDVMFRDRAALAPLYERLVRHEITTYRAVDILRFMGRKLRQDGTVPDTFQAEVTSDVKTRAEGVRIKHRLGSNSLKMYDKGTVLRVETTLNDPKDFKVFRRKEGETSGPRQWRPLRKGIADLKRRARVSQAANERLLAAQASVVDERPLKELADALCRPVVRRGRPRADGRRGSRAPRGNPRAGGQRYRALNPFSPQDLRLLSAIHRPEFHQNGFRNRDLRRLLYDDPPASPQEARRRSATASRHLALLRAHGLIQKVPKTHRYLLTRTGQTALTALMAARNASTDKLTQSAA